MSRVYNQLSLYMSKPLDNALVSYNQKEKEELGIGNLFGDIRKASLNIITKLEYIHAINEINEKHHKLLKKLKIILIKEAPLDILKSLGKNRIREEEDENAVLKEKVYGLLLQKNRREATEELVKAIENKFIIYTIRDDEFTEMWIYSDGIYIPQAKTKIKEYCRSILGQVYSKYLGAEVIDKIATDTYIDSNDFFNTNNTDEIVVENGILNIHTKELSSFTPNKIFFNKIPVKFDPSKKCINIEKHLKAILKNPKTDKKIILELIGYLLLKEYRIEKAFMFCGNGRNGKGKTLELMKRFIGIESCANIPLQQFESDQFAVGELFNKMVNLSGDIDRKALSNTGTFKQLCGRDLISASRKFKTRVHFINYAKMIFCANELPITYDDSNAFFNRWVLLDFPFTFVSKKELDNLEDKTNCKLADPSIVDKLTTGDELSGLLNLALDNLKVILKQKDFSYSKTAEDVKNIWLRKSSSLNGFLLDEIEEDWDSKISKKEFRKAYAIYCKKHKIRSVSDKIIKNILAEHGASDERAMDADGKQVWVWSGIKFSKGSQDSNGFSLLSLHFILPKSTNTLTNLTNLTKSEDSELEVKEEKLK